MKTPASSSARWALPAWASAAAVVLLGGCAQTQLVPAPQAQLVPGKEHAAQAQTGDVRVVVQTGAWSGYPRDLDRELTPLHVTIENRGNQPVRVRYEDFAIATGRGITYSPLPPLRIEGSIVERADRPVHFPRYVITPRFAYSGYHLAPWYSPYYTGLPAWPHPWAYSPFYYDTYYPRWTVNLPTRDMLEQAIPEGVVAPGGTVAGYLYFPEIDDDVKRASFTAELMQGSDGSRLGTLEVPFVTR